MKRHRFICPAPDSPAPGACVMCGRPEAEHRPDVSLPDAAGQLAGLAADLGVLIARWGTDTAAGEREPDAIRAGHAAVEAIDDMLRELHRARHKLTAAIRADQDATAAQVDAMLAEARARREAGGGR